MQLIYINKKIISLAIVMGMMWLSVPSFADADTSLYQEVITSSYSGGNTSSNSTKHTGATIEITSTSIIDGNEYHYFFSTSTPARVEHEVTIIDGVPISEETNVSVNSTGSEQNILESEDYSNWLTNMINLLNYLQSYVENTF